MVHKTNYRQRKYDSQQTTRDTRQDDLTPLHPPPESSQSRVEKQNTSVINKQNDKAPQVMKNRKTQTKQTGPYLSVPRRSPVSFSLLQWTQPRSCKNTLFILAPRILRSRACHSRNRQLLGLGVFEESDPQNTAYLWRMPLPHHRAAGGSHTHSTHTAEHEGGGLTNCLGSLSSLIVSDEVS
jgi:hypothetical protein